MYQTIRVNRHNFNLAGKDNFDDVATLILGIFVFGTMYISLNQL